MKNKVAEIFRYRFFGASCCGDEFTAVRASRYDIERLGFIQADQDDPVDLVIFQGFLSSHLVEKVKALKIQHPNLKIVGLGTCARPTGLFGGGDITTEFLDLDFHVPGCAPRPEAIMNALLLFKDTMAGAS